jgi:hypothetical protein
LEIWRVDGTLQRTPFFWVPAQYVTGSGETAKVSNSPKGFDPVLGTDLAVLQRSQAAVVAKELYARVLAAQGPDGPLATLAWERHAAVDRRSGFPVRAWWSPSDGELGHPDRQT